MNGFFLNDTHYQLFQYWMTRKLSKFSISLDGGHLIDCAPNHMSRMKVSAERAARMIRDPASNQVAPGNLFHRLGLPVLPSRVTSFFEKSIQEVPVMELFYAPAIHELFDYWIS